MKRLHSRTRELLKLRLCSLIALLGKSNRKVAAVFGTTPENCHAAVQHLRRGAEVPVWLFSTIQPLPETAALCEQIHIRRSGLILFLYAQCRLWRCWVAISAATWTGERGGWILKMAPFLVPPFRALLLNANGDFFAGTPAAVLVHSRRRVRDLVHSSWHRARDVAWGCWMLVAYHLWRSGPVRRVNDVSCGLILLLLSTVQRWCAYPGRNLFLRLHGNQPLELPSALPDDSTGVAHFVHTGSHWEGPALRAFAGASTARWILVGPQHAADAPDDMLPLFAGERTFAVARQIQFRAWKPTLLPTAPFRTLQKGEATQVLAPLSDTILVDRRKLLALGIPNCSLAGTAWLLLFWKAAAAGWRSYCIGHHGSVARQPDFPVQETVFISRVLLDPALRCLGPREPDLARGNIAFIP